MRYRARSIQWAGHSFRFERLDHPEQGVELTWAVSRRGEFIGTLRCPGEITTNEFDVRCQHWLTQLLTPQSRPGAH